MHFETSRLAYFLYLWFVARHLFWCSIVVLVGFIMVWDTCRICLLQLLLQSCTILFYFFLCIHIFLYSLLTLDLFLCLCL